MRTFLLSVLFAFALAIPAGADHCATYATSEPEVDTDPEGLGAPRFYVDNDPCSPQLCMFSLWVYQESNGIDGLQRGDEIFDDTCHGSIEADTIIF